MQFISTQGHKVDIHISNVLTDLFSNSLPEKTTEDIRMKFFTVSLQEQVLSVATLKSWNLFTNYLYETKGNFYVLRHVHRVRY